MTKIITYTYKRGEYSRRSDGELDTPEKEDKKFFNVPRISAEKELDDYLSNGWNLISTSSYMVNSSIMGNTVVSFQNMDVILYKEDKNQSSRINIE